ncbi:MAG: hypothetical protein E6Q56_08720 [Mycobacterium sp.]|nr:MAG: hypothetical protein E6Q56_08720 [Mycobacterium sp.]
MLFRRAALCCPYEFKGYGSEAGTGTVVGRVGALAVALGVGSAVAAMQAAGADTAGDAGSSGSAVTESAGDAPSSGSRPSRGGRSGTPAPRGADRTAESTSTEARVQNPRLP